MPYTNGRSQCLTSLYRERRFARGMGVAAWKSERPRALGERPCTGNGGRSGDRPYGECGRSGDRPCTVNGGKGVGGGVIADVAKGPVELSVCQMHVRVYHPRGRSSFAHAGAPVRRRLHCFISRGRGEVKYQSPGQITTLKKLAARRDIWYNLADRWKAV